MLSLKAEPQIIKAWTFIIPLQRKNTVVERQNEMQSSNPRFIVNILDKNFYLIILKEYNKNTKEWH